MIQHILPESISNNTETFTQILPHNILFVRVHITQYWHFWRVTTKYYYTHFSNFFSHNTFSGSFFLKKKTLWPLFVDGVQLPQGYSHFEEAIYFLPLSFWYSLYQPQKDERLEPPSGFEHGTPRLGIQHLNH